jgi:CheY-like chemotaxis protein
MSTCLHVVREHAGRIDLQSEPGKGTRAAVYFPRSKAPISQAAVMPAEDEMPAGNETILLAEDEPAVRELGAMLLRELGYNVIEADDGVAALAQLDVPDRTAPSLIVSDLVMPTMGGFELARRVTATHPHLPFLFTSGYSGEDASLEATIPNPRAFLSKPYSPRELAASVRRLIEQNAAAASRS